MQSDFHVVRQGYSIVEIRPTTEPAARWLADHVDRNQSTFDKEGTLICESRFAPDVLEGISEAGLSWIQLA